MDFYQTAYVYFIFIFSIRIYSLTKPFYVHYVHTWNISIRNHENSRQLFPTEHCSYHGIVIVSTHSCMFVTYLDSIRVIRRVSQLFRTYILLIPVSSCSFVNIFLIHPSLFLTHSGSVLYNSSVFMFVRVAFVLVRTDSCQFVPRS